MATSLAVAEILQNIFVHLDSKDLSVCATVNQQWSDLSLDVLWRDLKSLWPVCRVLSPLQSNGYGTYTFSRRLRHSDWDRLDRYAYRIQSLHNMPTSKNPSLGSTVFDQIGRTRPRLEIFPNLRHLEWGLNLFDCLLFAHPKLYSLSISIPKDFVTVAPDFSEYLGRRFPDVKVLCFTMDSRNTNDIDEPLISTIQSLPGLQVAHLPIAPSKQLFEALSRHPHLTKISIRSMQGNSSVPNISDIKFETRAFPSLQDVMLSLPYFAVTNLLLHPNFSTSLTHIHIESPSIESSAHFSELLGAISGHNGAIASVRLFRSMGSQARPSGQEDLINIRHIRPILNCAGIRSLELTHHYPFDLVPSDLEEIAFAFPHLEILVLNCSPVDISPRGVAPLPISSMVALTRCPKLQRLGLYFSTSTEFIPQNTPNTFFPHLKSLLVGKSTIMNPRALAFFLSHLCPRLTDVASGTDWMGDIRETPSILLPEWEEFAKWLPLLSEIRVEERAWAQHQLRGLRSKIPLTAPVSE